MRPLLELIRYRLLQFFREPSAVFWTFFFPLLIALALGLAFREGQAPRSPVAVLDGPQAEERMALLADDERVRPVRATEDELERLFRRGEIVLAVGGDTPIDYLYDPRFEEAVAARQRVNDRLQAAAGRTDPLAVEDRTARTEGTRYIDFLIPGLLGFNIMSGSLWSIGWVITEARRRKMLKRMCATPMRRSHFLLAHILARLVFLLAEVVVLLVFAWLVFDISIRGSLAAAGLFLVLGAMSFAGFGLLAASRSENSETVSGLINLMMFPMMIMSGVFFSSAHFPDWLQPFIQALPLTLYLDGLRGLFHGEPATALLIPASALAAYGAVTFAFALRGFKWN